MRSKTFITCTENGSWEADEVFCDQVFCNASKQMKHGTVQYEYEGNVVFHTVPWMGKARFTCKDGFKMFGEPQSTCLENGTWSSDVPHCQSRQSPKLNRGILLLTILGIWCPSIEAPAHTFMMGVGRQFGDVVRFACEQGFKMFGVQEVICTQTGQWNLPAPSCHSKD